MKTRLLSKALPVLAAAITAIGLAGVARAEMTSSPLLVNQWLRQAEDGSIQGRVLLAQADGSAVAVANAGVALASADGVALKTETDSNGVFSFASVASGRYTLLTRNAEDVCAIVALNVLNSDSAAAHLSSAVEISAGQISLDAINSTLIRYLPPRPADAQLADVNDVNVSFAAADVSAAAVHRVRQSEGGLSGQIYGSGVTAGELMPAAEANVLLFQEGVEVNRTLTNALGRFEIAGVQPGVYSVMIVGQAGFGLVGFELVGAADRAFATADAAQESLISAIQDGVASQLVFQLAQSEGVVGNLSEMAPGQVISDVLVDEQVVGEQVIGDSLASPMGGGFAGGGGGFGGGGGGGIGGGGGLAALGGLGAALAIGLSDNDKVITVSPATPPSP